MFHLRAGFSFDREGDEIVLRHDGGTVHTIRVPVQEWASAVAFTSKRGETGESYQEALECLERQP